MRMNILGRNWVRFSLHLGFLDKVFLVRRIPIALQTYHPIGVRPRLNNVIGNGSIEDEMIRIEGCWNADFARRQSD